MSLTVQWTWNWPQNQYRDDASFLLENLSSNSWLNLYLFPCLFLKPVTTCQKVSLNEWHSGVPYLFSLSGFKIKCLCFTSPDMIFWLPVLQIQSRNRKLSIVLSVWLWNVHNKMPNTSKAAEFSGDLSSMVLFSIRTAKIFSSVSRLKNAQCLNWKMKTYENNSEICYFYVQNIQMEICPGIFIMKAFSVI